MWKIDKELIKEFQDKYCNNCKSYALCGGDLIGCGCIDFENFLKERK